MIKVDFWTDIPKKAALLCEKQFPKEKEFSLQVANDALQQKFMFRDHWEMEKTNTPVEFANKVNWTHLQDDDIEWVFAFNRHTFLVHLAKAYLYTEEKKYINKAAELWESWIDNAPFTEESKKTTWRSIEAGLRCENWLRAISLFGTENLPPNLLEKIEQSLLQHAEWLVDAHAAFQKISNWGILQDHGLFLLGLAFGNENWVHLAMERLEEQTRWQVPLDGVHWEQSPMYHGEVLHCCLDTMLAARKAGVKLPSAFCDAVYRMAKALPQSVLAGGIMLAKSDSDNIDVRDLVCTASMLFSDANLKEWLKKKSFAENIWDFTTKQRAEYAAISGGNGFIGSVAHTSSGDYYLRNNGEGQKQALLHLHCGPLGGGHGHADLLHVNICVGEEMILTDTGRYTYVENELRKNLKGSVGHNTIIVDNQDFSRYVDSWNFKNPAEHIKGEYCFTPEVDYAEGLHLGYFKQGVLPRRRVLRLGQDLWVVWDALYASGKHNIKTLWHFGAGGTVAKQEKAFFYKSEKVDAHLYPVGDGLSCQLGSAPLSREYNVVENTALLTIEKNIQGNDFMGMVVAVGNSGDVSAVKIQLLPSSATRPPKALPQRDIQALKITQAGQEWLVVFLQEDVLATTDMFYVDGKYGHGRVVVFGPGCEKGLCLAR